MLFCKIEASTLSLSKFGMLTINRKEQAISADPEESEECWVLKFLSALI